MAASNPVIAFNNSSNPEIIDDGVTGFLTDDVDEMASRIIELSEDDDARTRLGIAGRKRVETSFTIDRSATCLEEYLQALE